MKKLLSFCLLIVLLSCNNKETAKEPLQETTTNETIETNAEQSAEDIAIQKWLAGKSWKPQQPDAAPFAELNLQANGNYELAAGYPNNWYVSKGELVLTGLTEWPIEKADDNSFKLGVKATEISYVYQFNKKL